MLNLKPTPGFIIIKPVAAQKSGAGVAVANIKEDPYQKGMVVASGGEYVIGENIIYPPCKPGDHILYAYNGQEEIQQEGMVLRIIQFKQVAAIYGE